MRVMRGLILLFATAVVPTLSSAQTYPSKSDPRNNLKSGRLDAGVAASNMKLLSFTPKPAQFDSSVGATLKINNATIVKADISASNGVIHVIDTVLMPK